MTDFLKKLAHKRLLIDGAMGTQLQVNGLPTGEASELWNLDKPAILEKIHREYVDAGADIILTNTFGGNFYKLKNNGMGEKVVEVNTTGAKIAAQVATGRVLVAASIGPTGEFLAPLGLISEDKMTAMFQQQIQAVIDGGADIICVETMSDPNEAACAVRAAKNISDIPVIASMTYQKGNAGFRTMMGNSIADCVEILTAAGADVIGTNCGYGIDEMIEIVAEMRSVTDKPIMAEPNAGLPALVDGETVYNETAESMASKMPELLKAGATIVGGCCGTNPEFIRLFRAVIDEFSM
ncbi:homocysteine S-methyltransferase family protein [bacterium]|nr:homocysteine S-methyltransferase family protein [bacterium]